MFLRITKTKGKSYLYLLRSVWKDGKSKHKLVASLGSVEALQKSGQLEKITNAFLAFSKQNQNLLDITQMKEKQRVHWGPWAVFGKLWEQFGLSDTLSLFASSKLKFNYPKAIYTMLLDRLTHPKSKKKSYEEQHRYYRDSDEKNALHHFYRALDVLSRYKQDIEEALFQKNCSLFHLKVNVVLYDVTTLYFESVKADPETLAEFLREFGYSKDGKYNEVQILLGLLVDLEGRPIGFNLFPGNLYEGHTFKTALETLEKRFRLNKVIIIGDQGMLNEQNVAAVKASGYEYILGGKLKNKSEVIKAQVLDPTGYVEIPPALPTKDEPKNQTKKKKKSSEENVAEQNEADVFKYKIVKFGDDHLICTWSSKRAKKNKSDRERLVEKAQKILDDQSGTIVSRRGALKYITLEGAVEGKAIDHSKIKEEEKWDGYYGIQTNSDLKAFSPEVLLGYYRDLWRVEESFRIFKTHLETRPMFHWTPKRIKGHMVLCFIAFLLERTLEIELRKQGVAYSPERIRQAINELQYSEIEIGKKTYFLRPPVTGLAQDILQTLKIKVPPEISSPGDPFWV